jgi:hypothetical protein
MLSALFLFFKKACRSKGSEWISGRVSSHEFTLLQAGKFSVCRGLARPLDEDVLCFAENKKCPQAAGGLTGKFILRSCDQRERDLSAI